MCEQDEQELDKLIDNFNSTGPLCPVMFNRLWLAKEDEPIECGHSIDSDCNCGPMFRGTGHALIMTPKAFRFAQYAEQIGRR